MTRDLEPGMVIRYSGGYWIVAAVIDGYRVDHTGVLVEQDTTHGSVLLLEFNDDDDDVGYGWEYRQDSTIWSNHSGFEVFE